MAAEKFSTRPGSDAAFGQLYDQAQAARFGFSPEQFAEILQGVGEKSFPEVPLTRRHELYSRLHLGDLALARGCAAGNERAWGVFMSRFREKLYDFAAYITKESSSARELADSVYADLYGIRFRGSERVCKLDSYTGRGTLEGWLRTVLAQEFVNTYRQRRRLVSLEEEEEDGVQFAAAPQVSAAPADARLEGAVHDALRAVDPQDRFILVSYFLDRHTLAGIGRALRVHESTISRKVEKLTKHLRKQIVKNLVAQGMERRQAEELLETDVRDLAVDVRSSLAQDSAASSFQQKTIKAQEGGS
jgi:RNA polymerase sigma-70 factor (ECF subfamily)